MNDSFYGEAFCKSYLDLPIEKLGDMITKKIIQIDKLQNKIKIAVSKLEECCVCGENNACFYCEIKRDL